MNAQRPNIHPLGDFKPADRWQTHINTIFYGIHGPGIHNHFQTYVSLDHRLAHCLAEDYFQQFQGHGGKTCFIQEWGVGNGNLAGCFLSRLKALDTGNRVYPYTHYVLCDYSREILNGVRANPLLQEHAGRFSTIQIDAENLNCFKPGSVGKIISNEIWDDLATKVLLQHDGLLLEEYLQPCLDLNLINLPVSDFLKFFNEKNLDKLVTCPQFLSAIQWEHNYQRVDISDWPYADLILEQMQQVGDDIPVPVNTGAFETLKQARRLLSLDGQGYSGFDYGMFSINELNREDRPYFNLYGGQYTFMVNFDLLAKVGNAIGFQSVAKERQRDYVGRHLGEKLLSVVEILQAHPDITEMPPWESDILMLSTLHAINGVYKSPYKRQMKYPIAEGTPKKYRKEITRLTAALSASGVPDTVAYVSESEVFAVIKQLKRLGYAEQSLRQTFLHPEQAIAFTYLNFQ